MPRHRGLDGTTLFPKNRKVESPFLDKFCELLQPHDKHISTSELYKEYVAFIKTLDLDTHLTNLTASIKRFAKSFASKALKNGWQYNTHKVRGYFVSISRTKRREAPSKGRYLREKLIKYAS